MGRITLKDPDYILVTSDPDKAEPLAPSVLNRAPEDIEDNVTTVKNRVEKNIENIIAFALEEYPDYDSTYNYMKGDVVKDSNSNKYVSITDSNKNNDLTDTDYWKEFEGIKSGVGLPEAVVDSDYNATKNTYLLGRTNDSTDNYSIYLPDSPKDTDIVQVADYDGNAKNNPVTVDGNGNTIEGDDTLSCDVNGFFIQLMYNAIANDWKVLNND